MSLFRTGDIIRVKKGAKVRYRGTTKVLRRNQVVKVNHTLGYPDPKSIVWAGSGGYWTEARVEDCELFQERPTPRRKVR